MENNRSEAQSDKLGFAFKLISEGAQDPQCYNEGKWSEHIREFRAELEFLNMGNIAEGNVATFLSYDEGGFFITLVAPVSGRVNDCFSGYIYVPSNLKVSGKDILKAYDKVKKVVMHHHNGSAEQLIDEYNKEFFNRSYSLRKSHVEYKPSMDINKWGWIDLNKSKHKLEDLFDRAYQEVFSEYKSIYIHEKDSKIAITGEERLTNLTDSKLVKSVVVLPPNKEQHAFLNKEGVQVMLQVDGSTTDEVFDKERRFKEGTKVVMKATREGFEDIISDEALLSLDEDDKPLEFPKKDRKWEKKVTRDMFDITSYHGDNLKDYAAILINGKDCAKERVLVSEDKLADCKITVTFKDKSKATLSASDLDKNKSSDKYADHNIVIVSFEPKVDRQCNLLQDDKCSIIIPIKEFQKRFQAEDGRIPEMGSVTEPSDSDKGTTSSKIFKCKWLWWIPVFLLVVLGIYYFVCSKGESHGGSLTDNLEVEYDSTSVAPIASVNEVSGSINNVAIHYLDNANGAWHRDSLEKYDVTKGLFDALNTYDYDWLFKHKDQLQQSDYTRLINVVEENRNHIKNLRSDSAKYNKEGDLKITVDNYIKKIGSR